MPATRFWTILGALLGLFVLTALALGLFLGYRQLHEIQTATAILEDAATMPVKATS